MAVLHSAVMVVIVVSCKWFVNQFASKLLWLQGHILLDCVWSPILLFWVRMCYLLYVST